MLEVQKFLENKPLSALTEECGIVVTEYAEYVVLNYSMFDSPKRHPTVEECRALILQKGSWKVLARSFDRFFNYGECPDKDSEFNLANAVVWEKIDGSLCLVWWNPTYGQWEASTRKMAYAEGSTCLGNAFKDVIMKALGGRDLDEMFEGMDKQVTYIFEVVSPETRVTKPYKDYDIYLLGTRNIVTGDEGLGSNYISELMAIKTKLDVRTPKIYSFKNVTEIVAFAKQMDAFDEGFVCTCITPSGSFSRIKIKNPAHVAISHLRENGGMSSKNIAIISWGGDQEEYLKYFPEDMEFFEPYIDAMDLLTNEIKEVWEQTKDIVSQKDFAMKVKDLPYSSILFKMRKGISLPKSLEGVSSNFKLDILDKMKR